jgi:hypothetical protein
MLGVFKVHARLQESLQTNDEMAVPQPGTHVVSTAETLKGKKERKKERTVGFQSS